MRDVTEIDHSGLDRPEILMMLFYPREEYGEPVAMENIFDLAIPVGEGVELGARFFIAGEDAPNILFFHGNGEIVSDYNDMGTLYNEFNINFFPVDYRGYGRSTGSPTITSLIRDSRPVFEFFQDVIFISIFGWRRGKPRIRFLDKLHSSQPAQNGYHLIPKRKISDDLDFRY